MSSILPPPPRVTVPPRPDGPSPRRRRPVAIALVLALTLVSPAVVGVVALIPWPDGDGDHAFLRQRHDGSPYRWDPCEPIHYEVNLAHAPANAMHDVAEAVARVSEASGIRFVFDGRTDRTPLQQTEATFKDEWFEYRPVLIAWLPAEPFRRYGDPDQAIGVGFAQTGQRDYWWVYKSGIVVINADRYLPSGFDHPDGLGLVLMHELGHVLGLGHVADEGEIMWSSEAPGADPMSFSAVTDWGDGDRAGLRNVGMAAGCVGSL